MEMPLRVYTPYLDLICEIDSYSSTQLERNYHDVGNAEIHINHHVHGAESIKKGNIITLGDSPDKAMFVRHMEIELTEGGKQSEEWTIKGPTLQGLMNQRITVPPKGSGYDRKSGAAETVMKHYVRQNFIDAANNKRVMKELLIAPDKERGEHVSHESRYKNVSDELANISKESGLGWIVYIDYTRHKFVFDVVDGLNLEQNNEENYDPVFFSPDFGTIKSQSFSDSDLELANHGYVAGQGEGKDRKVIEIGDKTGMNRFETFIDARDVGTEDDEDEEELTEEEIEKMLIDRGNKKMKELENELSLEAEILSPTTREAYEWKHDGYLQPIQPYGHYERKEQQITPFVYERDFDLGDTVPVYNREWGVTMTARITKIKEIHEPGGFRLEATFGKERPTLASKIRDNFNELNGIEKQEVAAQLVKKESKLRDEKLTQEKLDRIKQAQKNLDEALGYTQDYAEKKVHVGAEPPEDTDQKWLDTSGSHDKWRRYNHDASDNDNIDVKWPTTDVIDKDTTFANEWLVARHIESLNGLSVANGQLQITEDGNLKTSGDITGATGTFGDVNVKDGDFTLEDDKSNVAYSITPKRNLLKDHSFEMIKPDYDKYNGEDRYHNFKDVINPTLPQDEMWVAMKSPKVAMQDLIADSDALPIFGEQAIVVKDANYVKQKVKNGIGGNQTYTISGHFKKQWDLDGGKPRFEIDHKSGTGDLKERLINKVFDRVESYDALMYAATFKTSGNFGIDDYLDVKITGGDDNWVQCDGVQLVEGGKPSAYQSEDSVWDVINNKYKVISQQTNLWSGSVYLSDAHTIKPDKSLSDCNNGWILEWSAYTPGDGSSDSDWQYTLVPKQAGYHSGGFRVMLYRGGQNVLVHKYYYAANEKLEGHKSSGEKDNRYMALRNIYEF